MKIRILGCGPSYGMPSLSRGFGLCDPVNPKNTRTRSSLLLETGKTNILFDSDPEIRLQLLRAGRPNVDAVIYTHAHYDHMGGADDLRAFLNEHHLRLPVYLTDHDEHHFKEQMQYLIKPSENQSDKPTFVLHKINAYEPFTINGDVQIMPILQYHGEDLSMGYRIGDFAYSTDVKRMDPKGFELLKGIKTWVLGVVTTKENNKHIHLEEALRWIDLIKPDQVYLTHMGARMDYETLCNQLPLYIRPAYDGMELEV